MNPLDNSIFLEIVEEGNFFFPAYRHYGSLPKNVRCDRCQRTNLTCCIGFSDRDLCMRCVEIICEKNKDIIFPYPKPPLTYMMQDMFNPPLTRMEQDIFKWNK
jgi:hypothetical protein